MTSIPILTPLPELLNSDRDCSGALLLPQLIQLRLRIQSRLISEPGQTNDRWVAIISLWVLGL